MTVAVAWISQGYALRSFFLHPGARILQVLTVYPLGIRVPFEGDEVPPRFLSFAGLGDFFHLVDPLCLK